MSDQFRTIGEMRAICRLKKFSKSRRAEILLTDVLVPVGNVLVVKPGGIGLYQNRFPVLAPLH